jgi:hypothetical protein
MEIAAVLTIVGTIVSIIIGLIKINDRLNRPSYKYASNQPALYYPQYVHNTVVYQVIYVNNVYVYVNYGNGQYYLQDVYVQQNYHQYPNNPYGYITHYQR